MKIANRWIFILYLIIPISIGFARVYEDFNYNFQISVPDNWEVKEGIAAGTVFKAVQRDRNNRASLITVTVHTIGKENIDALKYVTPEEVFNVFQTAFGSTSELIQLYDSKACFIGEHKACWHKYRHKVSDSFDKIYLSYTVPINDKYYMISGASDYTTFSSMENILSDILSTFNFFEVNEESSGKTLIGELEEAIDIDLSLAPPYINTEYGFEIRFPKDWEIKGSSQIDTVIKAVLVDGFKLAMISIAAYADVGKGDVWDLTGNDMFNGFMASNPSADAELLDWGKDSIDNNYTLWTKILIRDKTWGNMIALNYHLLSNGILYRLSGSASEDSIWYEANETLIKKSISTFHFEGGNKNAKPITSKLYSYRYDDSKQDSSFVLFIKSYGRTTLLVLITSICIYAGKMLYGKLKIQRYIQNKKKQKEEVLTNNMNTFDENVNVTVLASKSDMNEKQQSSSDEQPKTKGKIMLGIGIAASFLMILSYGFQLYSLYTEYQIISNEKLLLQLGYNPADFNSQQVVYRAVMLSIAFMSLLAYLVLICKKNKLSLVFLLILVLYSIIDAYFNITSLSYEEQIRGLTTGAWVVKIISWLPKYLIELGLISLGYFGLVKYNKSKILFNIENEANT